MTDGTRTESGDIGMRLACLALVIKDMGERDVTEAVKQAKILADFALTSTVPDASA